MKGLFFKALTIEIGSNSIFTIGLNYSSVKLTAGRRTNAAFFSVYSRLPVNNNPRIFK